MRFLVGIVFVVVGIVSINPSTAKALIRFNNKMDGTKTEISSLTLNFYITGGVIAIIAGLAISFGVFGDF